LSLEQKEKILTQVLIDKAKSKENAEDLDRITKQIKKKEYQEYLEKKKNMKAQLD